MTEPSKDIQNKKIVSANPSVDQLHAEEVKPIKNNRMRKTLVIFSFILLVLVFGWFLLWLFYFRFHMTTDDAYSNGSIVNINTAVDGSVIAFYVDNTDFVVEGDLLVKLDPTYYQVVYEKTLANLAAQALQVREYYDTVFVNLSEVEIRKINLSKAQFDFENRSQLISSKAISNEDFIHSRDDLTVAENELKKAMYQLIVSQDVLGSTPLETHPRIEEKKAEVRVAYYNLKHCELYAPTTGYVAMRAVNVGQSVKRESSLMAIIPSDYVWVDANFKETQLKNMRVGQPASVWFDLYGSDVEYKGKVIGIASGSGNVFSLIPPQNATGNWIKIVQRLSVRISLDSETVKKYPVRLGISAEVDVDITDQNLPRLQQIPPTKPVKTTNVFDISLKEVDLIIDEVVQMNLYPKVD